MDLRGFFATPGYIKPIDGYSTKPIETRNLFYCADCKINFADSINFTCPMCYSDKQIFQLCILCEQSNCNCDKKEISSPSDNITLGKEGNLIVYKYQNKPFHVANMHQNRKYAMPLAFSHFLFRQSEARVKELEGQVKDLKRSVQELLDRIEFAPDGKEAEEAVKRIKSNFF